MVTNDKKNYSTSYENHASIASLFFYFSSLSHAAAVSDCEKACVAARVDKKIPL